ncbi:MAG: YlxR family protein [Clostridia bacterium]|nr:YlxR family protein [Oscillospiraceae bacterium]MBQ6702918.1 YlxR family protein [Clostridia bacterium]
MGQQLPKKKIPERKCSGCGMAFPKPTLLRVVRAPDGSVSLDFTGKKSGRGAYVCRSVSCFKKARKAKRFERSLECEIPEEVYDALERELSENE